MSESLVKTLCGDLSPSSIFKHVKIGTVISYTTPVGKVRDVKYAVVVGYAFNDFDELLLEVKNIGYYREGNKPSDYLHPLSEALRITIES